MLRNNISLEFPWLSLPLYTFAAPVIVYRPHKRQEVPLLPPVIFPTPGNPTATEHQAETELLSGIFHLLWGTSPATVLAQSALTNIS